MADFDRAADRDRAYADWRDGLGVFLSRHAVNPPRHGRGPVTRDPVLTSDDVYALTAVVGGAVLVVVGLVMRRWLR